MIKYILTLIITLSTLNAIVIDKEYFKIDFSEIHKGATKVTYNLDNKVNKGNIKSRDDFYVEIQLPENLRVDESLYTNTGFDRGHIASDASFDWSESSKNATYSMANIVPQYPVVNRKVWADIEEIERYNATQFSKLEVINLIDYSNYTIMKKLPINRIIENQESKNGFESAEHKEYYIKKKMKEAMALKKAQIHVPSGFYKIMINNKHKFKECYYVPNLENLKSLNASDYKIECSEIKNKLF